MFICLSAGISLPTSGYRHQKCQESLLEKEFKSRRVAINLPGSFCPLGESSGPLLPEENLSPALEVHQHFKRARDGLDGRMLRAFSQPNPRVLSSPSCRVSHHAAGPGSTLGTPSRAGSNCPILWSQHQLFPATDTSTTEQVSAESLARCQRGSMGKASLWRQPGRGPRLPGQQPGQAHVPVTGSRSSRAKLPAVLW